MIIDLTGRYMAAFQVLPRNVKTQMMSNNKTIVAGSAFGIDSFKLIRNESSCYFGYSPLLSYDDSVFAPPPLIQFRRSKKLIETPVSGTDYEVVEKYSTSSWEIRMQGLIIDMTNHKYPSNKVVELRKLFDYDGIWNVEGQIFSDLGIEALYFKEQSVEGLQGYEDTFKFDFSARSSKKLTFTLINNEY